MGIVLLHILQWVLRIIFFLLLLLFILTTIVLLVPIRYQAQGEYFEKIPKMKGKVTWFFYLVYMSFVYESNFNMQIRVFGFKVFDTKKKESIDKEKIQDKEECFEDVTVVKRTEKKQAEHTLKNETESTNQEVQNNAAEEKTGDNSLYQLELRQKSFSENNTDDRDFKENKKEAKETFKDKLNSIKLKIQTIFYKIRDSISKIQQRKLKAEHYLELWNRKSTQITFKRVKKKLGKVIKAIFPRKWKLEGEIGFDNPATTGQFIGCLGTMYPLLGNKVQIIPNFEEKILQLKGNLKGHIRLGNLVYQVLSLLLNPNCFKFIKMIFDELSDSKNSEKEI